ncbi:hypothetical protein EV421DRAFT_2025422 [Armillaria borealis]|uniref:Uncharacterized protein n=1 Tax=Armillaria borealis TaxID=47425 RepID=A0AA39MDZ6_9AGAR|nr:hypothetical protein EV421DRAFT_2025422 [Armillaria borealis]
MFRKSFISNRVTLEAAGLVALADLSTVVTRTALTGTASYLDALVLAPGLHQQQSADEVNHGEIPTTGAMTTGYVFRVENPATVRYLQTIGRTGHLVTPVAGKSATLLHLLCPVLTTIAFVLLGVIEDWWGIGVLWMLVLARFVNVVIIKQRSVKEWKGAPEPDVDGDLLILLSQDRWVRLQGSVDDLKAVTAGQWLRELSVYESYTTAFATLLVYVSAALAGNASKVGSLLIACLLLCSVALLGVCNSTTKYLQMYDRVVRTQGEPKKYERRLDMAADLIVETGRKDWAIGIALVKADEVETIIEKHGSQSNKTGSTDNTSLRNVV